MNLAELITAYGGDDVQFQALDTCADRMNMANGHTKITFGTGEPLGPEGTVKMGVVVWMDRDRVEKILAADKATTTVAGLSEWSGWDRSNLPWSQAKHKDALCYAAFGPTWSMEDAAVLISFIERTWRPVTSNTDEM
jgi:hypothetical protein